MGSLNKSHTEPDGGILLFNGELILLYCDSVSCEVGGKESFKGRVYLTTHRLVVIMTPFRQNAPVKSFCAPFCAITKCGVEQPVFGANYIEATVRDESDLSKSFSFKLKFSKGGAIELAMAMNRAVQVVGRSYNPRTLPPPAYSPSPSAQYYQAPPTVYAPGYNSGVPMPTQQFPDQPPIGFIYTSDVPPPYPGLSTDGASRNGQSSSDIPQLHHSGSAHKVPGVDFSSGQQPVYPPYSSGVYPQQAQGPTVGYPSGEPQQPQRQQQTPNPAYPDLSGGYPPAASQQAGQAWPSAPSYNPNWQDDKKNA